ncbi:MAG: biosynthetic arginine decarboxylase [Gammaproteobacteria bacterium]
MVERVVSASRESAPSAEVQWTPEDSTELYRVESWGDSFFRINEHGHASVQPFGDDRLSIDFVKLIEEVERRAISFPVLIRFQDVLQARVRMLNEAFASAIEEAGYGNSYTGVYPIKVNQLHEVVEEVLDAGRKYGMGLECGSKGELIACLPHLTEDGMLLVCNGVKDRAMLALILSSQRLGLNVIPVMEKFAEFETLLELADAQGQVPILGVRVRLATRGSGRWSESGGARSKFGLSIPELVRLVAELERRGKPEALALLHFHIGSQIIDIQVLKRALKEMTQIYASLHQRGIPVRYVDVGGGLGVSYGAGHGRGETGVNYGLQEYANAVVFAIKEVCDAQDVPNPIIVSESGRAITAHHSVLLVPVLEGHRRNGGHHVEIPAEPHAAVESMVKTLDNVRDPDREPQELIEAYHDIEEVRIESRTLFSLGYLELGQLAAVEDLYWSIARDLLDRLRKAELDPTPAEELELEDKLTDRYLCNFSVFQSILDHWAIDQSFPILPIDCLDEKPDRRAVLVDLTCDSDGKVSHYISAMNDKSFLPVHSLQDNRPYYLGFFLMGAYQDIMGDAHNLFGRVPEVHVYADAEEQDNFWIERVIPGATIHEMLAHVQYFPNDLSRRMSDIVKRKIDAGVIRPKLAMDILGQYVAFFNGTTYCDAQPVNAVERPT